MTNERRIIPVVKRYFRWGKLKKRNEESQTQPSNISNIYYSTYCWIYEISAASWFTIKMSKKEIRIDFRVVSARQRLRSPLSLWFSSFIVIFFVCCSLRFCWFKLKALILVWFPFLSLFGSRFLLFLRGEFFYWLEVSLFLCFSASSFANKVKWNNEHHLKALPKREK